MKKQLFFWLLMSAISISVLENMVASVREGKAKVWEPAREPETLEAAKKLEEQSKIKEQDAQKKLEEAKLEKNTEEVDRQEKLFEGAKFDRITAEKKINVETLKAEMADPAKIAEANAQLEARKKVIEQKIQAIENELAKGGTSIGGGTIADSYKDAFQEKFKKLAQNQSELIAFMQGELIQLGMGKSKITFEHTGPLDYAAQKEILKVLNDVLATYRSSDEKIIKIKDEIKNTLTQIDTFEKNPPQAIPNNAVDSKLQLSEKIPSDQIKVLKKELGQLFFEKEYKTPAQQAKALDELRTIVDAYDIADKGVINLLNERLLSPSVVEFRIKEAKSLERKNAIITDVLKTARLQSVTSPEKYTREADLLKNLATGVSKLGLEFAEVVVGMNERLQEINNFKPGQKPRHETALGKELKLTDKISFDKIVVLQEERGKAMADYRELAKTDENAALKNLDQALKDIQATMQDYSLTDGRYKELYDSISNDIAAMKAKIPEKLPAGVSEENVAPGGVIDALVKGTLDQGTKLLITGLDAMQGGVDYLIAKEMVAVDMFSEKVISAGEQLADLGNSFETVPDTVSNSTDLLETINQNVHVQSFKADGTPKTIVNLVAGKKVVGQVDRVLKSAENTEILLKNPTVKYIASKVGVLGRALQAVGKAAVEVGNYAGEIGNASKKELAAFDSSSKKQIAEKTMARKELEKALERLKNESLAPSVGDVLPVEVKRGVKKFFADLYEKINAIFNKPKGIRERLNIASKNYENARTAYAEFLGVAPNASVKVIDAAIANNPNKTQQKKLETTLLNAAKSYTGIVQEYAGILKGVGSTVDLIISAPDSILIDANFNKNILGQEGKLVEDIDAFIDIRRKRQAYLSSIQGESARIFEAVSKMTAGTPVDVISNRVRENIAALTEGALLNGLGMFVQENNRLETDLRTQRDEIQKKLPKVATPSSGGSTSGGDGPAPVDGGDGEYNG